MDKYLSAFREMIFLRGLTAHTVRSYSTYISAYLNYLTDILHKQPEDVYRNCQAVKKEIRVDKRRSEVIDTPYFHVVFTLPFRKRQLVIGSESDTFRKNCNRFF